LTLGGRERRRGSYVRRWIVSKTRRREEKITARGLDRKCSFAAERRLRENEVGRAMDENLDGEMGYYERVYIEFVLWWTG
jgi:hypothetical protein